VISFVIRRIGSAAALVFVVLTAIFLAVRAVPGDPALLLSGGDSGAVASEASLALIRERLGLDQPLWSQYLSYLAGLLHGDLGQSFRGSGTAAADLISTRLPYTLELVAVAAVLAVIIGIPLGSWAGRRGGTVDAGVSLATSIGLAIPVYVLGAVLILVFALHLRMLPSGSSTGWDDPLEHLRSLILPAVALAVAFSAVIARMTRSSVIEVSGQDWVRTGHAIGLTPRRVFREDVLRNALTPVVTVIGLEIGALVGSSVMVERVFNYPGLSSLLIDAVSNRDYPVVQGIVIVVSLVFIVVNLVVDILYGVLDPRVRSAR
jgi:peptide/nickel transport system permease protein